MARRAAALALVTASLMAGAPGLTAHNKISLRVTPTVSREPAFVNVIMQIERNPANRSLQVTAESAEFFRSSTISLEGEQAPRIMEIAFKSLPGGEYNISAVLVDAQGNKSIARSSVLVVSAFGGK